MREQKKKKEEWIEKGKIERKEKGKKGIKNKGGERIEGASICKLAGGHAGQKDERVASIIGKKGREKESTKEECSYIHFLIKLT